MYDVLMYCTAYLEITIHLSAKKISSYLLVVLLIFNQRY